MQIEEPDVSGRFGDDPFSVFSRYTHVYVRSRNRWHLVSAQGTKSRLRNDSY